MRGVRVDLLRRLLTPGNASEQLGNAPDEPALFRWIECAEDALGDRSRECTEEPYALFGG